MLAAGCLLLLGAPERGKPSGSVVVIMVASSWALEIAVAVGEVDRRVLCVNVAEEVGGVGLITCVWSWVSHSARHPTPVSEARLRIFTEGQNLEPWIW